MSAAGSDRSRLPNKLLRCHIAGSPHRSVAHGQGRPSVEGKPRQSEIGDLGRAVGGEQDVGLARIAVHDPALESATRTASASVAKVAAARRAGCGAARQGLGQAALEQSSLM